MRYQVLATHPAEKDLEEILRKSMSIWGQAAQQRYLELFNLAYRLLQTNPYAISTKNADDLLPGLRRLPLRFVTQKQGLDRVKRPAHVIYYRLRDPNIVEILRILHEHMDVTAQLESSIK